MSNIEYVFPKVWFNLWVVAGFYMFVVSCGEWSACLFIIQILWDILCILVLVNVWVRKGYHTKNKFQGFLKELFDISLFPRDFLNSLAFVEGNTAYLTTSNRGVLPLKCSFPDHKSHMYQDWIKLHQSPKLWLMYIYTRVGD